MPKKPLILVVDDEPHILMMLNTRLTKSGYAVIQAETGTEALEKARAPERPDLILLDVNMPPPNGFQVCRTLKDDPQHKTIPIILLTAKTTESDQFWGMESGADAYITKPYNPEDLLSRMEALLG